MKSDFYPQGNPAGRDNFFLYFLSLIKGLGPAKIRQYLSGELTTQKIIDQINKHLSDKDFLSSVKKSFSQIKEPYISILDKDYPANLKNIYDPPLFLFYRGNIKLLNQKNILTVVGSRSFSSYHNQMCQNIINNLRGTDLVIASGLAIGTDSQAHNLALENNLPTIAVLGSGLDDKVLYPQGNRHLAKKIINQGGLLISEYSALAKPQLHNFPRRNRILAGLSKATIVISGAKKSGTLITAQVAIDEGKEVLALPGNINTRLSEGPNNLIKNGAQILTSGDDILNFYGLKNKNKSKKIIFKNKLHAKIYSTLQTEPLNLDKLAAQTNISLAQIGILISEMEIQGIVKINQFNQVEIICN
ncbi:DNA-processing protein DprA [Patescibacteria group bacterium]|nr:DNA-processing protein DprA [Patescibacteria group bacterium]